MDNSTASKEGIALVGMAGRFPGAADVERFWDNLARGEESIRFFRREELLEAGVDPGLLDTPGFVPASGHLEEADLFDPYFFGLSARDAEILDPQHRLFLEQAWVALESAGLDPATYEGLVGVFGGMSASSYLLRNLLRSRRVLAETAPVHLRICTDKDFLTSRVAYKLGLNGPSVTVQSACSTSLVAVTLACQSLLAFQCDAALAGGVSVASPLKSGSFGQGDFFTADGHCRAFDAAATGTPNGYGVGVVVLKRLEDALADGDRIRAVIRGFATNNDGNLKAGYTAPSVEGQEEVVATALAMAGVDAETIGFVEAHGTGTPIGDPIEVAALAAALGRPDGSRSCALGSVKTNIGHLDAAAGAASLIKTVLALEHGKVPPSLNFERPNPNIDFDATPFFVNSELIDWPRNHGPRRAGVSSFAVGGVNAHLVLEEAPPLPERSAPEAPSPQLLVLSARTETALRSARERLGRFLRQPATAPLGDVAHTLQTGRRAFSHRCAVVAYDDADAVSVLSADASARLVTGWADGAPPSVYFLFPGLGDQYGEMGLGLYQTLPVFRREVDRCAELLVPHLGADLRALLYPRGTNAAAGGSDGSPAPGGIDLRRMLARRGEPGETEAGGRLGDVRTVHPALFVIEYALARSLMALGIEPRGMVGFSLGEYVAACLAGVFGLEESLRLVADRARIVSGLPPGAMLAVGLSEQAIAPRLPPEVTVAAVCSGEAVVVAGPEAAVSGLADALAWDGVTARRLGATHAFHTPMLEPAREAVVEAVRKAGPRPPSVPFLSNLTGRWITDSEATDPEYWGDHLVHTVRFADDLSELWKEPGAALVEAGPGWSLGAWALQHPARREEAVVVSGLRHGQDSRSDQRAFLEALAKLWTAGIDLRWLALHEGADRRRVELPSYPFERERLWVEPDLPEAGRTEPSRAGTDERSATAPAPEPARPEPDGPRRARPNVKTAFVAPESELERQVASVWAEILGLDEVGAQDDFFALGGESMRAPRLLLKLKDLTGVELTLRALFQAPTPAQMASLIEQARGQAEQRPEPQASGLLAEAALDPAVTAADQRVPNPERPSSVLLTGATGFLGAHLVVELAARTEARIVCLVRADDPEHAAARIRGNLERYELWSDDLEARLTPVVGDLTRPALGLPAATFDRLAAEVESIYHAGAWVNATYDYQTLAPSNVSATQELLRLAGRGRTKPLHFVSTLAVFTRHSCSEEGVAYEDAELSPVDEFESGYVRTKWVGEHLVRQARERGIPATVFRAPLIGGSTRTGLGNPRDLVWNLLKGCIQLGATFEMDNPVDISPVDYVSRAIVHLSTFAPPPEYAFHLTNPGRTTWNRLCEAVREAGYRLEVVPYATWLERLEERARAGDGLALTPFLPVLPTPEQFARSREGFPGSLRHDATLTERALAGSGIECPPVSQALVSKYLEVFVRQRFLPEPEAIAAG